MSLKYNHIAAFPHNLEEDWHAGMSLRDYFAGMAVIGCLTYHHLEFDADAIADNAYEIADAMLAAREAK
jgi:hypothetical protein